MDGLIMALQMILALSIIVGIHELGHLIAAKIFGMKVEKYYIGFPPKIWSFKYKDTEYGLGSIPLGGFVKISGIIDESFEEDITLSQIEKMQSTDSSDSNEEDLDDLQKTIIRWCLDDNGKNIYYDLFKTFKNNLAINNINKHRNYS